MTTPTSVIQNSPQPLPNTTNSPQGTQQPKRIRANPLQPGQPIPPGAPGTTVFMSRIDFQLNCIPTASMLAQQQQHQQQEQQQPSVPQTSTPTLPVAAPSAVTPGAPGVNGRQLFISVPHTESGTNGENLKSDTQDKNDCIECVEKTNKIQTLKIEKDKAKRKFKSLKKSNAKYRKLRNSRLFLLNGHTRDKYHTILYRNFIAKVKIQALRSLLRSAKAKSETEVVSAQYALEETKVECVEKTSKIQTLEIEKLKLETEITSAQKALEESKAEAKVELEKVEHLLQTEAALKKSLEESNTKYRKLRQDWVVKIYQSDPDNEDLDNLLSLEPEKLFKKYEQLMKETTSD